MVVERLPLDEEEVAVRSLDPAMQVERDEPVAGRDDRTRLGHRFFELGAGAGPDVDDCVLENHRVRT
jgi:hypothetical protein